MSPVTKWLWAAHGKHPSAKDFFSIGRSFSLASNFSEWIRKGYQPLTEPEKRAGARYSWRFWARGGGKEELTCGLLRDSHDSFGRPYPLLIIGNGPLPSWEEHWEKLPAACERVWCRIESVSARGFAAIGEFEEEIIRIRPPDPCWSNPVSIASGVDGNIPESPLPPQVAAGIAEEARNISLKEMGIISLGNDGSNDRHHRIMQINTVLKSNLGKAPNTLFIGGTDNESSLIIFRRPMRPSDLSILWGMAPGND